MPSRSPGKASGCPGIYGSFRTIGDTTQPLEFISPYKPDGSHCDLLFKGRTTINNDVEEVLVKVAHGGYGEEAHRVAAQEGFAPKLYGVAKVDGAPPAYVMEFLSDKTGWVSISKGATTRTPEQWDVLKGQIKQFLSFMQKNRLVHGDLRPKNIFLRDKDGGVELRILDWDWAGEYGSARYPLDRNPAAELPGNAGELIDVGHDVDTLGKYFEKAMDSSGQSSPSH
jgi:serine/threonine protein kinase